MFWRFEMERIIKRAWRRAVFMLGLLGACSGCIHGWSAYAAEDPQPGKEAPEFVRYDLANKPIDLAALRGRVVLLNFWATWCAPCQVEIPRFIAWQSRYNAEGLQVIGVSMDDDPAPVRSLVHKRNVTYPMVMGDEKLGLLYGGVLGLPVTYLIDREGTVRERFKGETNLDTMEASLRKLLRP